MSNRTRSLILGVTLAAMNLAGLAAVAQAQTNDQDARRPPSQGQVGETWRQPQATAEQATIAGDPRRPPTESQVGESWRHPTGTPVRPADPSGPSSWLVTSLGVLAVVLILSGGLPCWPPGYGQAAGLGPGTQPDHARDHPNRRGCRVLNGQPC